MIYRLKLAKMKTPEHVWFKLLGTKVSHKTALEYINKQNSSEGDPVGIFKCGSLKEKYLKRKILRRSGEGEKSRYLP